jgi:hypothetical protein
VHGIKGYIIQGQKITSTKPLHNPPSSCVPIAGTKSKPQTFVQIDDGETTTVEFAHRCVQSGLVSGMTYNML